MLFFLVFFCFGFLVIVIIWLASSHHIITSELNTNLITSAPRITFAVCVSVLSHKKKTIKNVFARRSEKKREVLITSIPLSRDWLISISFYFSFLLFLTKFCHAIYFVKFLLFNSLLCVCM